MQRPKASPHTDEGGRPPPYRSWQAPPDGLFDVIVPQLTAKQFVVVQLVCKDWSHSARYCLKDAAPKRPDVDLSKLVALYPNLTQLNLSHLEGWTTRMLTPLRQLTALRELCVSNIVLQHNNATLEGGAADAAGQGMPPAEEHKGSDADGAVVAPSRARSGRPSRTQSPLQPRTRSRARAAAAGPLAVSGGGAGGGSRVASPAGAKGLPPLPGRPAPGPRKAGTSSGKAATCPGGKPSDAAAAASGAGAEAAAALPGPLHGDAQQRCVEQEGGTVSSAAGPCAGPAAEAAEGPAGGGGGEKGSAAGAAEASSSPSPPLSPASRIFGGLGDVLLRLTKLQADLCPALSAESIAALPSLTDLTLDTLIAPAALAPLARLRSLAVKKLANPEHLDRLSSLTALLVNSDSSCASEFLPACTRLPQLRSLTFKTSSTKVIPNADELCWQGFSRLSSLDLRVPVEVVKPGLCALAELPGLCSLALDLYCASDEELMVTVVAPPNLTQLFVSSDRSRSGGVIDVHPNARLRSLRLRLYWTALNLVLPEGVPEPSPLPEPLSEDLMDTDEAGPSPGLVRRLEADLARNLAAPEAAAGRAEEEEEGGQAAGTPGAGQGGRGPRRRVGGASPSPRGEQSGGAAVGSPGRAHRRRLGRGKAPSAAGGEDAAAGGGGGDEEPRRRAEDTRAAAGAGPSGPVACAAAETAAANAQLASAGGGGVTCSDATDERADTDSCRGMLAASPASGGAAAAAAAAGELHGSQRCRHRQSGGGAASPLAAGAGSATPAAGMGSAAACCGGAAAVTPGTAGGGGGKQAPLLDFALEELCLDACFFLLYGSLVPLLRQFPRLRSLTLDNSLALENGELAQLCELTGLRELSLSAVHLLKDSGLRAVGRLSCLTSLRLRGLRKMSMHAAQSYMRQKPIVRRYEEISGSFLTALAPLSELRCLALKHLHTAGEAQLAAGLRNLTQLTRLEVKDVHSMSDTVLASLSRHTRLRELSVLHCEAVTVRGRTAVVRSLGQRLALDFEGCSLPDITRPCALPTTSTQAQLIDDDQASSSNRPRRSCQHSNQH